MGVEIAQNKRVGVNGQTKKGVEVGSVVGRAGGDRRDVNVEDDEWRPIDDSGNALYLDSLIQLGNSGGVEWRKVDRVTDEKPQATPPSTRTILAEEGVARNFWSFRSRT